MNNQTWNENQIVQAYEKNFDLLEAGRKEYEQSVNALLDEITAKLNDLLPTIALDGLRLNIALRDEGFARHVIEYQLIANEGYPRLPVFARMATPWGGCLGCLQIGVAAQLDERWVSQNLESLRQAIQTTETPDDMVNGRPIKKAETHWLRSVELEIDSKIVHTAAEYIATLLCRLRPLVLTIDAEFSRANTMQKVLEKALQSFKVDSSFPPGWSLQPKVGWWNGMHYIQLDCENRHFWVGYHVGTQRLMYGHHELKDDSTFSERLFAATKAKPPKFYGGHPAGVVLEKDDLANKSSEEIEQLVSDLFRLFYATVNGSASFLASAEPS